MVSKVVHTEEFLHGLTSNTASSPSYKDVKSFKCQERHYEKYLWAFNSFA